MSVGDFDPRPASLNNPPPAAVPGSQPRTDHGPLSGLHREQTLPAYVPPAASDDSLDEDTLPPTDPSQTPTDPIRSADTLYEVRRQPEAPAGSAENRPLQRIAEVRKQQGVSCRNIARRLNLDMETVRRYENPASDLPLSVLYEYQKVLDVPVADLLVEQNDPLSAGVLDRARLVRLMKTAAAILEKADGIRVRRLAQMLVEQLIEMMPELKEVSPWHAVGRRRSLDDYGRTIERIFPEDVFGNDL
ncbi:MAG TPA: helix-turn-helix domain-containing protein [Pirellulales bacterium]|jgi:transcriptional regulator with XRE-family HTH domain|nr:helix-turn-helix domain-containing protein [Pirellulales bacterium]